MAEFHHNMTDFRITDLQQSKMPLIRLTEPTAPQSPPSDLSTPNVIPSVAYGPTSDGRDDPFVQPGIAALGEPTHPACFLDGADTDPNVSSIEPPHPDNLVNPFPGVPHKFYNVTVGDKVGIHSDWYVASSIFLN
jgi:hypothetical protein